MHARLWVQGDALLIRPTFPSNLFVWKRYRLAPDDVNEALRGLGFIHLGLRDGSRLLIWAHDPPVIAQWVERAEARTAPPVGGHS
jgi:hypothetical protein